MGNHIYFKIAGLIEGPNCKLEKRGDEIKKKSSPLKLLRQSQPNFAEMNLGWSSSKIVSGEDFFLISSPLFSNLHNRSK
jgi:hypothetical protein